MEALGFLIWIIGLVLSIVLIVAQFQLFAIKRCLNDLLQVQLALHGITQQAHLTTVAIEGGRIKFQPLEVSVVQTKAADSVGD
jgi:hypothetical protein